MPFNKEKRSKEAKKRPRDKSGHFIPLKPKVKVTGAGAALSDLINTEKDTDPFTIFTLKMGAPWQKLINILEEIKNKQTTTVALRFSIPLIALPIAILMAFQFGRYQSSCTDYFSSQVGTLQNITVTRTLKPDNVILRMLSYLPYADTIYNKTETLIQPVLIKEGGQTVIINNQAGADLDPFTQSKIITFGNYNSCTQTLTLDSPQNISNH